MPQVPQTLARKEGEFNRSRTCPKPHFFRHCPISGLRSTPEHSRRSKTHLLCHRAWPQYARIMQLASRQSLESLLQIENPGPHIGATTCYYDDPTETTAATITIPRTTSTMTRTATLGAVAATPRLSFVMTTTAATATTATTTPSAATMTLLRRRLRRQ